MYVVVVHRIATLIVEIDAVVVAVENRILFTNFFTFFTFTVQFCVVGVVVVVVGQMANLAAHRISFGHNGKVGFCAGFATLIRKILQIRNLF